MTIAAISSMALVGCEDLDTLPHGTTVSSDQKEDIAENKPERAEAGVTAIFAQFTQYGPNYTAFGSVLRHNDIGYPTIMMATDANGQDVVMEKMDTTGPETVWTIQTEPTPVTNLRWYGMTCIRLSSMQTM